LSIFFEAFFKLLEEVMLDFSQAGKLSNWNLLLVFDKDKLQDSLNQITDIVEQLFIIFLGEVIPGEDCIGTLGSVDEQIVSPHFRRDSYLLGIITKYSSPLTFRELTILIVQILGCRYVMQQSPVELARNKG
jgi:hypothetical protein